MVWAWVRRRARARVRVRVRVQGLAPGEQAYRNVGPQAGLPITPVRLLTLD